MPNSLYLCYFGLSEPLVQTQVLPYLREIKKINDLKVSLLTFEPKFKKNWNAERIQEEKGKLAEEGITWYALPYHKTPSVPVTIYDVLNGARFIINLSRKGKIDILHARSHVAALMGVIAKKFSSCPLRLLFDIRGFLPEEYTDASNWKPNGKLYKTAKRTEKWLFKESDAFVVLTEKARDILFPESKETGFDKFNRPVEVIPCCFEKNRFEIVEQLDRETIRKELNLTGKKVFIYIGSFGGWYLTDEMMRFLAFTHQQDSNAFIIVLTQRDVESAKNLLKEAGLDEADFLVNSVSPDEIPKYLKAADVALSFIKPSYSKQASSPTKIAEYLAGGLPIISNAGVGDLDELIEGEGVGVIIDEFSEKEYELAIKRMDDLLQDNNLRQHTCRIAEENFDIEKVGGERYRRIYQRIYQQKP